MEKSGQPRFCAYIRGRNLERAVLRKHFGKFGKTTKIFVNQEHTLGKVYFEEISDLRKACIGVRCEDWVIEFKKDDFKGKNESDSASNYGSTSSLNNLQPFANTSAHESSKMEFTEQDFSTSKKAVKRVEENGIVKNGKSALQSSVFSTVSYDYVDSVGRPVEVLENDDHEFFVNLQDVRRNGFQIFRKTDYDSSIITRMEDLREFEGFLLNQGLKFLIDRKRMFNENEVLNCIENVKSRLWGNDTTNDANRTVTSTNTNNLQITARTTSAIDASSRPGPSQSRAPIRPPQVLAQNFKPSSNQFKPTPKEPITGFKSVDDQRRPLRKPHLAEEPAHQNGRKEDESWEVEPKPEFKAPREPARNHTTSETASVASGTNDLAKCPIERENLPVSNEPYTVVVTHVQDRKMKDKLYYVQLKDNTALVEQLLIDVNTLAPTQNDATPVREGLFLVLCEDVWYRALLIHNFYPERCFVELIDYGNKEWTSGPYKEVPDVLKQVKGQSIRVHPDLSSKVNWQIDDVVEVVVKRQYDDGTHLVSVCADSRKVPPKPKEESKVERFFKRPGTFATIKPGDQVKILKHTDDKLILVTKECVNHKNAIIEYIQNMNPVVLDKVEENQLVLCSHEGKSHLCRAVVTSVTSTTANVEYLDFPGEVASLSLKSLKNVDAHLAKLPRAFLEPAEFPALKNLNPEARRFLSNLTYNLTKLVVEKDNDLKLIQDQKLLSDVLRNLNGLSRTNATTTTAKAAPATPSASTTPRHSLTPKPAVAKAPADTSKPQPKAASTPAPATPVVAATSVAATPANVSSNGPFLYQDMPYYQVRPGVGGFIAFCCQDSQNITLISTNDDSVHYMAQMDITPENDKPYAPNTTEMCLVLYEDAWYRATVIDVENGIYEMLCVDFGSYCSARAHEIRKISKELAEIPIIGLSAFFADLPVGNAAIDAKLKELIPDQTPFDDVNVVSVPDNDETIQYGIKIESITQQLKAAGLL